MIQKKQHGKQTGSSTPRAPEDHKTGRLSLPSLADLLPTQRVWDIADRLGKSCQHEPERPLLLRNGSTDRGPDLTLGPGFHASTLVQLREGARPIGDLRGRHDVLTSDGEYHSAEFGSCGCQTLYHLVVESDQEIYVAGGQPWPTGLSDSRTVQIADAVPTCRLAGRGLAVAGRPKPPIDSDYEAGVRHGVYFGACETAEWGADYMTLRTDIEALTARFGQSDAVSGGEGRSDQGRSRPWRPRSEGLVALPSDAASLSYWRGFIDGLIAASGEVDERGDAVFRVRSNSTLSVLTKQATATGFVEGAVQIAYKRERKGAELPAFYEARLLGSSVEPEDAIRPSHRKAFERLRPARSTIRVVDVHDSGNVAEVYTCSEPITGTFVIGGGLVTCAAASQLGS